MPFVRSHARKERERPMMRQRLSSAVSLPALCSVFVDTKSALVCAFFFLSFPFLHFFSPCLFLAFA